MGDKAGPCGDLRPGLHRSAMNLLGDKAGPCGDLRPGLHRSAMNLLGDKALALEVLRLNENPDFWGLHSRF